MSEWKNYDGSDEQVEEMLNAEHGFVVSRSQQEVVLHGKYFKDSDHIRCHLDTSNVTEYLICKKHPLADMIKRWADTQQPVYWRHKNNGKCGICVMDNAHWMLRPFYSPDYLDYSFTPFSEE